jgi:serine/threonine protein kinase
MVHMATGSPPFPGLRDHQIIMHVGLQKRSPAIPSSLPEPLQQLLSKCLAVDPEQRPSALDARKVRDKQPAGAVDCRVQSAALQAAHSK